MIVLFKCAETEKNWQGFRSRKLPSNIQARALDRLKMLNRAKSFDDLRNPPGNRLHSLKDDRDGHIQFP